MADQMDRKGVKRMASVEKFKETAVVNILRHNNREINSPSNTDIDFSLSDNNYALHLDRGMSDYDYYLERKSEVYCYGRDDVNVMVGWVVTVPEDLPVDEHRAFFEAVNEFLDDRYNGEHNCIQSIVHCDESGREHLHYNWIPTVPDIKHGGEKINAGEVLTRAELRNFHPDLQRYLDSHGFSHAKVHTGVTAENGGNRTVKELKESRDEKDEIVVLRSEVKELREELGRLYEIIRGNIDERSVNSKLRFGDGSDIKYDGFVLKR